MKKITHKIIHWLNLSIITFVMLLVTSLATLYFYSNPLTKYHKNIERFASKAIQQPVEIETISVSLHKLKPTLKLHNVAILNDAKTKKLLKANELQIGIDIISSLIKQQIKPGLLLIRGSEITIKQNKKGKINISGIPRKISATTETNHNTIRETYSWLFELNKIYLEDITLKWHQTRKETIKLHNLSLELNNDILQHKIKIAGKIKQKGSTATFKANLKLHNIFLKQSTPSIKGNLTIENCSYQFNPQKQSLKLPPLPTAGEINLTIKKSNFKTNLLRQPMPVNNISGKVSWQHRKNDLKIAIDNLRFADNWLNFKGDAKLLFPHKSIAPIANIKLKFKLINLAKAKTYYPTPLMPHNATTWLDKAFTNSKKITGKMTLEGPLAKFPFDNDEGKFLIDTDLNDVDLKYDADWPAIEKINGKMIFANRSLTITANNAEIMGEPTKMIKASIPDLELPILHIVGAIDTKSSVGLKFVNSSPLKNSTGHKLQNINLTGPMQFNLKLDMPLSDDVVEQDTHVKGNIELHDNQLQSNWGFKINNLNGNLKFTDDDLTANNLQGELFNKPAKLNIKTLHPNNKNTTTRVEITGNANTQNFEKSFAVKLHPHISGNFGYQAFLDLTDTSTQNAFQLTSDLQGIEIKLPKPFAKKITDHYQFKLTCRFGNNQDSLVTINYNNQINAALKIKKTTSNNLEILAGEIKLDKTSATIPTQPGLTISGKLAKLDWQLWKDHLTKIIDKNRVGESIIKQIQLNIEELFILGKTFKKAFLKIQQKNDAQKITLTTNNIDGIIYLPNDPQNPIKGIFKKLHLGKEEQKLTELKPKDIPSLECTINNFRYGNNHFNKVVLSTENQTNNLKIKKLNIGGQNFYLETSGSWSQKNHNHKSILQGKLQSNNFGKLLKTWKLTNNVSDGAGEINFSLNWPDKPLNPTLTTIDGPCSLNIKNGRIINLGKTTENKLGLGRVLSMLSLQSLPRRLALDFSDLSKQGFSFDTMKGEIKISKENASVKKLILNGPVAIIKAYGRIGLKAQDYNIMLGTVPHLTSSIPIAATIAGGPVIGLLTLVADKIVSQAIEKTTTYDYHITGPWANPKIKKINQPNKKIPRPKRRARRRR